MTEFKKAWDGWLKTAEFTVAADPFSIGVAEMNRRYLENRLHTAFSAGWRAAQSAAACGEAAIEKIVNDPDAPWNHDVNCPVHQRRGGECDCEPLLTKDRNDDD